MLKAYKIETGARYWVAAKDWVEALATWARMEDDHGQKECAIEALRDGIRIDSVGREDLATTLIFDEQWDRRPLGTILEEQTEPSVMACSEWP